MTPEIHLTITGVSALAVLGAIWKFSAQAAAIQVKVDTLWDFVIRRGHAEGLHAGALAKNSPLTLTPQARRWFDGIAPDLQAWYRQTKGLKALDDRDLTIAIERQFGARITEEICIPHKVHDGACLAGAVLVCREVDSLP